MRRIDIAPLTPEGGSLTGYLHDPDNAYIHRGPRPALLVIPGGGYRKLVEHEGDPVAWEFFTAGFHTFVLTYASEWDVHPRRVAVMGFSAGGHLAGSCAVLWDRPELRDRLGAADEENRPDAAVLAYPAALTLGPYAHPRARTCLAGDGDPAPFDLPSQVRPDTPPCFVWSTMADEHVPVENSLALIQSLRQNGVPCELHLYTEGRHGLGLGTVEAVEPHPHLATWVPLCKRWMGDRLDFPVRL